MRKSMRIWRRIFLVILTVSLSVALALLVSLMLSNWASPNPAPELSVIVTGTQVSQPSPTSGAPTTTQSPSVTTTTISSDLPQEMDDAQVIDLADDPCNQWYVDFLDAGWSADQWDTAKWLIYRESRCDPYAFNGVDAGLLQINEFHRPLIESYGLSFPQDMFHGETNLWVALTLWQQYGWEPWIYKGVVPGE